MVICLVTLIDPEGVARVCQHQLSFLLLLPSCTPV